MRKTRFTETQIVSILREHDAGASFVELGRRHGVHPNTISAWKAKYGGMDSAEIARGRASPLPIFVVHITKVSN